MRVQELLSRRRVAGAYLGLALLAALPVACTDDSVTGVDEVQVPDRAAEELRVWDGLGVTVMTWNVYVGADLESVLQAPPQEIPLAVAQAFQTVVGNDFPARAEAIARQVARFRPHLIGLQEVSKIYIQSPGDAIGGGTVPAEDIFLDYLDTLQVKLEARGLDYNLAGMVKNFDVEMPMVTSPTPTFDDVRLQDYEVVLARGDVEISRVAEGNYYYRVIDPGTGIEFPCGYVAVEAAVGHKTYRFVSTHLQALWSEDIAPLQTAQAQELVGLLQDETIPVIVVGDFNSRAADGELYERQTYNFMLGAGYVDTWTRNLNPFEGEGLTNAQGYFDLTDPTRVFDQRIDFIFARNEIPIVGESTIGLVVATLVGDARRDRTRSGLWPSDHAGIAARLYLF
jgi:endonuclease/exonuclease/phosphatase family metal-dependent hydrolase